MGQHEERLRPGTHQRRVPHEQRSVLPGRTGRHAAAAHHPHALPLPAGVGLLSAVSLLLLITASLVLSILLSRSCSQFYRRLPASDGLAAKDAGRFHQTSIHHRTSVKNYIRHNIKSFSRFIPFIFQLFFCWFLLYPDLNAPYDVQFCFISSWGRV